MVVATAPPIQARARSLVLQEGLYAVSIGAMPMAGTATASGMTLPAVQVSAPPSHGAAPVEIGFDGDGRGAWFGLGGGVAVVRAGGTGGVLLVTTFAPDGALAEPSVGIRRLDDPRGRPTTALRVAETVAAAPPPPAEPDPEPLPGELRCEFVLHIEREGDRRFDSPGWVGHRGGRLRIEAFSVRPIETLNPADIEYKAFGPGGRETPWVSEAKLCGTRGLGIPLVGFAVRLPPALAERFDAVYSGSFFSSGIVGPVQNGEPCRGGAGDDPLDAILLRLVERRVAGSTIDAGATGE